MEGLPVNVDLNLDFGQLSQQKEILVRMIQDWGEADDEEQRNEAKLAEGLLNVLDSIQDQACEVYEVITVYPFQQG